MDMPRKKDEICSVNQSLRARGPQIGARIFTKCEGRHLQPRDHVADEGGRGCSSQGPKDKIRDLSLSGSKICEGVVIQDTGDRVAHRSHDVLNRALGMICIGTVSTFLVGGLADAPDRR